MIVYISDDLCYIVFNVGQIGHLCGKQKKAIKEECEDMNDAEKLDLILSGIQEVRYDISELKTEMTEVKKDISELKKDVSELKTEMTEVKKDISVLKIKMSDVEENIQSVVLQLENRTNRDIKLLAENFVNLIDKLNEAIPVADKNLAYEVKVDYLIIEVRKIKKCISELKSRIA